MYWRALRESLAEYDADPRSQLAGLQDLIHRCQDGIETQVNTARGDILDIVQKRPEVELAARKELRALVNDIYDRAEAEEMTSDSAKEAPTLTVRIVKAVPEVATEHL